MKWAARCECYAGHNSRIGRCNAREVTDPTAGPGDAVKCERCRRECETVKTEREVRAVYDVGGIGLESHGVNDPAPEAGRLVAYGLYERQVHYRAGVKVRVGPQHHVADFASLHEATKAAHK